MAGRGKPGREPDRAKRELFTALIARGVFSAEASRTVGINPRTGKRWRNGRTVVSSSGRVLEYSPVIAVRAEPSGRFLSQDERFRIADLRREGLSMRQVAARLNRSPSTVSRELGRHARQDGAYRPFDAHRQALRALARPRRSRLAGDAQLREYVTGKLKAHWSPEQIAHELRVVFPDAPSRWVCAETIYQGVYRPDLGGLPRELSGRVLRRRRRQRLARRHAQARRPWSMGQMVSITDRPATVLDRLEPGHWEGDLIVGSANKSAIITLVERTTRYTLLGHLPGRFHGAEPVRGAVIAALAALPAHLRRTLTWDQGSEMALHEKITIALDLPVYFADPHSPWQRPTGANAPSWSPSLSDKPGCTVSTATAGTSTVPVTSAAGDRRRARGRSRSDHPPRHYGRRSPDHCCHRDSGVPDSGVARVASLSL